MKKLVDDEKMNQLLFEDLIHLEDIQIERFTNLKVLLLEQCMK